MTNIYFIRSGEEIKIGRSQNIKNRLKELQTGNQVDLELLYIIENVEESFEKHIHSICSKFHLRGEWFMMDALTHLLKHPYYKENMKKPNQLEEY